jgi:hypothetical protein
MSRKEVPTPVDDAPKSAELLADVTFTTPLLHAFAAALGRYLRHDVGCASHSGSACSCGLMAAIAEVQRREQVLRRYGTE